MRSVSRATVTRTPILCKMEALDGYKLIRTKQRLVNKRKRGDESFSIRQPVRKSCVLTIHWNLAKPVKMYLGISGCQTPHRSETHGIAEWAVRRVKEGTSAVPPQSGLDEKLVG